MRYKKTPDENGWFWIEDGFGEWRMAYLNAESCPQRLTMFDPVEGVVGELEYIADGSWIYPETNRKCRAPRQWIGPVGCPGGELADRGSYFSTKDYDRAEETGRSLVMVYVDHGDKLLSSVTMVGLVPDDEARDIMYRAFRRDRENKPAADTVGLGECGEAEERGLVPPGQ